MLKFFAYGAYWYVFFKRKSGAEAGQIPHFKENTPVNRICIKDYGYGRKKSKNKNKLSYKCKLYACKALKFVGELIICVICFPCACVIVKSQCR